MSSEDENEESSVEVGVEEEVSELGKTINLTKVEINEGIVEEVKEPLKNNQVIDWDELIK